MDLNRRDELDQIIDRGLTGYSSCEPLAGLEDRVLNHIRLADAGQRPSRWWHWALVVPVLAALVIVAVVSRTGRAPSAEPIKTAHVDSPPPSSAPALASTPDAAPSSTLTSHTIRRPHRVKPPTVSPRALPKRDQFPTPTPLTPDERTWIALAQHRPAEVEAFAELQKRNSQEITIPPIEIPPLRIQGIQ